MNDTLKELHFLERDYKCPSSDDSIKYGKDNLLSYSKIDEELVKSMEIHYQYHLAETKEELQKLVDFLFNPKHILVSYSVYCQGSDSDFLYFMKMAGRNDITKLTYIDTSGCLLKFLNRVIKNDTDSLLTLIKGINYNNIITLDYKKGELQNGFFKIEFAPSLEYSEKGYFKLIPVNILDFIQS